MLSVTVNAGLWAVVLLGLVSYVFLRPLHSARRVPNAHWSSGLSPLWILWTRYRNRELAVLEEKHRQLGPIVRLGPADLSISCYENGARTIYNGGFEKPEYYSFFSYYAHKNAFCSLTRQDHSLRRKRITAAYTKSAVFTSEPLSSLTQTVLLARLLPILEHQASSNQPTDVLALSYALSLDLLTGFQFGLSSASDFLQTPASLGPWIRHYEQRYCKAAFWPQELPTLTRCLKAVGVDMLPASQRRSTRFLEDWLLDMCERAERAAERGLTQDTPVVYRLVKRGVEADMPGASEDTRKREIASELFDQMSGGREVLGLVLAYTIFYISQNPSAQARLRAELASLEPGMHHSELSTRLPSPSSLEELPYLSAVLKESFRMRPTSTPLPRVTPRDRPVSLAGVDGIPPGTRVNVFQWLIHRNPDNYSRADEWRPERWLTGPSPLLWPFGGGSRMCVGIAVTQYLMRYILAMLYSNFSSSVVSKRTGAHEPGSSEDEIMVQFQRVSESS